MAEVVLQRSRIDTLVCQLEAAGMAQHVRMDAKCYLGGLTEPLQHSAKAHWAHAGDMQEAMHQVYLLPPQPAQFGGRVPVAMAVVPGSLHKPLDLTLRQVLTLAVMGVGQATSANCSL